jgi:quercetin dioxygenase-like cupin family protein
VSGASQQEVRLSDPHFPARIRALPRFEGPFDARRLEAPDCEVLFASYPAGTAIAPHAHETENCGVITQGELILVTGATERRFGPGAWYRLAPGEVHAARFEVDTSEVEFWFRA